MPRYKILYWDENGTRWFLGFYNTIEEAEEAYVSFRIDWPTRDCELVEVLKCYRHP